MDWKLRPRFVPWRILVQGRLVTILRARFLPSIDLSFVPYIAKRSGFFCLISTRVWARVRVTVSFAYQRHLRSRDSVWSETSIFNIMTLYNSSQAPARFFRRIRQWMRRCSEMTVFSDTITVGYGRISISFPPHSIWLRLRIRQTAPWPDQARDAFCVREMKPRGPFMDWLPSVWFKVRFSICVDSSRHSFFVLLPFTLCSVWFLTRQVWIQSSIPYC